MVVSMDILISKVGVFMDFVIVMCNALYFFVSIFGFINDINAFFRNICLEQKLSFQPEYHEEQYQIRQ